MDGGGTVRRELAAISHSTGDEPRSRDVGRHAEGCGGPSLLVRDKANGGRNTLRAVVELKNAVVAVSVKR